MAHYLSQHIGSIILLWALLSIPLGISAGKYLETRRGPALVPVRVRARGNRR